MDRLFCYSLLSSALLNPTRHLFLSIPNLLTILLRLVSRMLYRMAVAVPMPSMLFLNNLTGLAERLFWGGACPKADDDHPNLAGKVLRETKSALASNIERLKRRDASSAVVFRLVSCDNI